MTLPFIGSRSADVVKKDLLTKLLSDDPEGQEELQLVFRSHKNSQRDGDKVVTKRSDGSLAKAKGQNVFHGAWTGGFSAGYFNSVDTKEGWTPQEFFSRRRKGKEYDDDSSDVDSNGSSGTKRPKTSDNNTYRNNIESLLDDEDRLEGIVAPTEGIVRKRFQNQGGEATHSSIYHPSSSIFGSTSQGNNELDSLFFTINKTTNKLLKGIGVTEKGEPELDGDAKKSEVSEEDLDSYSDSSAFDEDELAIIAKREGGTFAKQVSGIGKKKVINAGVSFGRKSVKPNNTGLNLQIGGSTSSTTGVKIRRVIVGYSDDDDSNEKPNKKKARKKDSDHSDDSDSGPGITIARAKPKEIGPVPRPKREETSPVTEVEKVEETKPDLKSSKEPKQIKPPKANSRPEDKRNRKLLKQARKVRKEMEKQERIQQNNLLKKRWNFPLTPNTAIDHLLIPKLDRYGIGYDSTLDPLLSQTKLQGLGVAALTDSTNANQKSRIGMQDWVNYDRSRFDGDRYDRKQQVRIQGMPESTSRLAMSIMNQEENYEEKQDTMADYNFELIDFDEDADRGSGLVATALTAGTRLGRDLNRLEEVQGIITKDSIEKSRLKKLSMLEDRDIRLKRRRREDENNPSLESVDQNLEAKKDPFTDGGLLDYFSALDIRGEKYKDDIFDKAPVGYTGKVDWKEFLKKNPVLPTKKLALKGETIEKLQKYFQTNVVTMGKRAKILGERLRAAKAGRMYAPEIIIVQPEEKERIPKIDLQKREMEAQTNRGDPHTSSVISSAIPQLVPGVPSIQSLSGTKIPSQSKARGIVGGWQPPLPPESGHNKITLDPESVELVELLDISETEKANRERERLEQEQRNSAALEKAKALWGRGKNVKFSADPEEIKQAATKAASSVATQYVIPGEDSMLTQGEIEEIRRNRLYTIYASYNLGKISDHAIEKNSVKSILKNIEDVPGRLEKYEYVFEKVDKKRYDSLMGKLKDKPLNGVSTLNKFGRVRYNFPPAALVLNRLSLTDPWNFNNPCPRNRPETESNSDVSHSKGPTEMAREQERQEAFSRGPRGIAGPREPAGPLLSGFQTENGESEEFLQGRKSNFGPPNMTNFDQPRLGTSRFGPANDTGNDSTAGNGGNSMTKITSHFGMSQMLANNEQGQQTANHIGFYPTQMYSMNPMIPTSTMCTDWDQQMAQMGYDHMSRRMAMSQIQLQILHQQQMEQLLLNERLEEIQKQQAIQQVVEMQRDQWESLNRQQEDRLRNTMQTQETNAIDDIMRNVRSMSNSFYSNDQLEALQRHQMESGGVTKNFYGQNNPLQDPQMSLNRAPDDVLSGLFGRSHL